MEGETTTSATTDLAEMYRYAVEHGLSFYGNGPCNYWVGDLGRLPTENLDALYIRYQCEVESVAKSLKGESQIFTVERQYKMAILKHLIEGRDRDAAEARELLKAEQRKRELEKALAEKEKKKIEEMSIEEVKAEISELDVKLNTAKADPKTPVTGRMADVDSIRVTKVSNGSIAGTITTNVSC